MWTNIYNLSLGKFHMYKEWWDNINVYALYLIHNRRPVPSPSNRESFEDVKYANLK